jgi:NDP-sugar pyrophosphorylase family protein
MKAVILAAGKGTRMGELTKTIPKGLLIKQGRPLLEYTLSEEGTHAPPCLLATGAYYLNDKVFDHPLVQIPGRDEFGLPQTVVEYAQVHPVRIIEATSWIQVTTPADLQ